MCGRLSRVRYLVSRTAEIKSSECGHNEDVMRSLVLLAAISAAAIVGLGAARGETRPALRLVDASPVTFRGTGFEADEHVRVFFVGTTRAVRRVVASAQGRFSVRFADADANACTGFSATAVGDQGSRATFKRAPGQCPVP